MERFLVYLMSKRVLHVNAKDENDAQREAIVWHQNTDAVELVERDRKFRSRVTGERRVVRVSRSE